MPKGQNPTERLQARYDAMDREIDRIEKARNNTMLAKAKRKIKSLYMSEDQMQDASEAERIGQRAISQRHNTLLQRVMKIEKNWIKQGNR